MTENMGAFVFYLKKTFAAACLALAVSVVSAEPQEAKLNTTPLSPLSDSEISALTKNDTQPAWTEFSKSSKDKALEFAKNGDIAKAASWLYTAYAADLFAGEKGGDIQPDFKGIILKNLPEFFDFYETVRPEDSMNGVCEVLATLYQLNPAATSKNLRHTYAVSLICDTIAPPSWPECRVPSGPTQIKQPQELFNIFMEDSSSFSFPINKLTVRELIFVYGIGGPLGDLRDLKNPKITPSNVERLTQSIKTDMSRLRKNLPWDDSEYPYTLENIKKVGGLPVDKVYYAWRTANANAIPSLYFCEVVGVKTCAWLWVMTKPGVWKPDVGRENAAKSLYGRPLDPQTWNSVDLSQLWLESKNRIGTPNVDESLVWYRLSTLAFERAKYADAVVFAENSRAKNPENWKCYGAFISAKARNGAENDELDKLWVASYETFRKYPDICIYMLNNYRANLIMRHNEKEADKLFNVEAKAAMRLDPGFGVEMYSRQLSELFAHMKDKTDIFGVYQDVLRSCANCKSEAYTKIVVPLANLFSAGLDDKSAYKTHTMFESTLRQDEALLKLRSQTAKEKYMPSKKTSAAAGA